MSFVKKTWYNKGHANQTPLNADTFNDFEGRVEKGFNDITSYSTEEILLGKWIDEKPLYRKVLIISPLPNNNSVIIPHNIANVKDIISVRGCAYNITSGFTTDLNFSWVDGSLRTTVSRTDIGINTDKNLSVYGERLIIEYTKTTD